MPTYRIGQCVQRRDETYLSLETVFPDEAIVRALPDFTRDEPRAAEMGVSVLDLWRTHDTCHLVAAEALHLPWSPTLYRVAHCLPLPPDATGWEESVVEAMQRFVLNGEKTGYLRVFAFHDVSVERLRERVLAYLHWERG